MVSHVCLLVVNVRVFRLLMKEVQNCGILEGDPKPEAENVYMLTAISHGSEVLLV